MAKQLLLVTAITFAALTPQAARSADVSIGGMLVPQSCSPTLDNSGDVDWGAIAFDSLSDITDTALAQKFISINFACSAGTLFAVRAQDNRRDSLHASADPDTTFGLGRTARGQSIGFYRLTTDVALANGATSFLLQSEDLVNWSVAMPDVYWQPSAATSGNSQWRSFGADTFDPAPVLTGTFRIGVEPFIRERGELQLTEAATIDGSTTLEIVYL